MCIAHTENWTFQNLFVFTYFTNLQRVVLVVSQDHIYFRFTNALHWIGSCGHRGHGWAAPPPQMTPSVRQHFTLVNFIQFRGFQLFQMLNPGLQNWQPWPRTLGLIVTNLLVDFLEYYFDTVLSLFSSVVAVVIHCELGLLQLQRIRRWSNVICGHSTSHLKRTKQVVETSADP